LDVQIDVGRPERRLENSSESGWIRPDDDGDGLCAPETVIITLRQELTLDISNKVMLKNIFRLNTYIITGNLKKYTRIMTKSFTICTV
jgi:hypothetical protein